MSETEQHSRSHPLSTNLERIGIVTSAGIVLAVVLVVGALFVSARTGRPAQQLQTEILVEATPSRVWEVATTLNAYASWNPYMSRVVGSVEPRATIKLVLQLPDDGLDVTAVVERVVKNREFSWQGHRYAVQGLSSLEYAFRIEPLGSRSVRVVQTLNLRGLLLPFQAEAAELLTGLERMAQALEQRAERPAEP